MLDELVWMALLNKAKKAAAGSGGSTIPAIFAKPTTIPGFEPDLNYGGLYYKGFNFPESGYGGDLVESFSLIVSDTYTVEWDGTEYSVVAQDASAIMPGAVVLGNAAMLGLDGNNEPFAIAVSNGTGIGFYSLTSTEPTHTVGIYPAAAAESGGSGGGSVVVKMGEFTEGSSPSVHTITHGLGCRPDVLFLVMVNNGGSITSYTDSEITFILQFSVAFQNAFFGTSRGIIGSLKSPYRSKDCDAFDAAASPGMMQSYLGAFFVNDDTTFQVGTTTSGLCYPRAKATYRWYAIGGLT